MHYYQHNIGDFASATRLLGPIEIGVAQILIDEYARTEKPLASDFIKFVSESLATRYPFVSESQASGCVSLALRSLFVQTDAGYTCPMLDEQIKSFSERAEKNRLNASKPRKRAADPKGINDISESLASGKPVASQSLTTNNQEPITNNQIDNPLTPLPPVEAPAPKSSAKRGTRLTLDTLPDEWAEWLKREAPDIDPEKAWADFHDYWVAVPGAKGLKLDWLATFRNAIRSIPDWKRESLSKIVVKKKNRDDYLPNSRFKRQECRDYSKGAF